MLKSKIARMAQDESRAFVKRGGFVNGVLDVDHVGRSAIDEFDVVSSQNQVASAAPIMKTRTKRQNSTRPIKADIH